MHSQADVKLDCQWILNTRVICVKSYFNRLKKWFEPLNEMYGKGTIQNPVNLQS